MERHVRGRTGPGFARAPPTLKLAPDGGVQIIRGDRFGSASSSATSWRAGFERSVAGTKRAKSPTAYRQRRTIKSPLPSEATPRAKRSPKTRSLWSSRAAEAASGLQLAGHSDKHMRSKVLAKRRRESLASRASMRAGEREANSESRQDFSPNRGSPAYAADEAAADAERASIEQLMKERRETIEAMQVSRWRCRDGQALLRAGAPLESLPRPSVSWVSFVCSFCSRRGQPLLRQYWGRLAHWLPLAALRRALPERSLR